MSAWGFEYDHLHSTQAAQRFRAQGVEVVTDVVAVYGARHAPRTAPAQHDARVPDNEMKYMLCGVKYL